MQKIFLLENVGYTCDAYNKSAEVIPLKHIILVIVTFVINKTTYYKLTLKEKKNWKESANIQLFIGLKFCIF